MKRGDVVVVRAKQLFFGKPRPAVVVQSDATVGQHPTISICPLTSQLHPWRAFRVDVAPTASNRLAGPSQAMVDKVCPAPREALVETGGALQPVVMHQIDQALQRWLSL